MQHTRECVYTFFADFCFCAGSGVVDFDFPNPKLHRLFLFSSFVLAMSTGTAGPGLCGFEDRPSAGLPAAFLCVKYVLPS